MYGPQDIDNQAYMGGFNDGYNMAMKNPERLQELIKNIDKQREGIMHGIHMAYDVMNDINHGDSHEPDFKPHDTYSLGKYIDKLPDSMDTIDPEYKLMFNTAYQLSQKPDTNDLLKRMIDQAKSDIDKHAMLAGRQQFMVDAIGGQDITKKRERTESEALDEYYKGMEAAYERGEWASIGHAPDDVLIAQRETKSEPQEELTEEEDAERIRAIIDPPRESDFKPSDRVGEGPALSEAQKKEFENFEHSQRARAITKDAKDAAITPKQQEAIDRMAAARKRRQEDKNKDGGRD